MLKPKTSEQKATRTVVDTIGFTKAEAQKWKIPPFQRPLKVNDKVQALAVTIGNDGGVIPGVMTFGRLAGETFIVDGQHRREAFLLSGRDEGFADTRTLFFESMAEMGEEFVRLNSQLVRLRPDDILRGLEGSLPQLQKLIHACPYVGYDYVRRGDRSPIVSMSAILRLWEFSRQDVPSGGQLSAATIAKNLTDDERLPLQRFLSACIKAWGRDEEYVKLWGTCNLTMCAWLYRRSVLTAWSGRTIRITDEQFIKCLMSLSTEQSYLDWLVGRLPNERDRAPCYSRITEIFGRRLQSETGKKSQFPRPAWALGKRGRQ